LRTASRPQIFKAQGVTADSTENCSDGQVHLLIGIWTGAWASRSVRQDNSPMNPWLRKGRESPSDGQLTREMQIYKTNVSVENIDLDTNDFVFVGRSEQL
jgi:hypothetical protein